MIKMDSYDTKSDDRRQIYAQLNEHSVSIASLQSGLASLTDSTESGFKNIANRLSDLSENLRSSKPQLGAIASIIFATCGIIGALAGFALRSSTLPIQTEIRNQKELHGYITEETNRRLNKIDERIENIVRSSSRENSKQAQ